MVHNGYESLTVGKKIEVGQAISKSIGMITSHPVIMIPQLIVAVITLAFDLLARNSLGVGALLITIVPAVILGIIVSGAYPEMVQNIIAGSPISIERSLRIAAGRFWSLLAAGILVGLLEFVGFVALIVPGIIIYCWYFYTVPAIMLESKGATAGMSASKAFGRDKKWNTFKILVVIAIVYIVLSVIRTAIGTGSTTAATIVYVILTIPAGAFTAIISTYVYITFGPSSTPTATGMMDASAPGAPGTMRYCPNCGTQVDSSLKFCPNCGKPLQ
ncbi:MAG: zinc ribbon domain-containing protein [Thaumarchaeota archaeon]|nr:zinc ribbon domain-containing protein [Nitrososphaerota archaeon]